jgi:hypothetical protein
MDDDTLRGLVDTIVAKTPGLPEPGTLASWAPALSGDIDIRIDEAGRWYHAGTPIQREGLVRLFASLLRRESDGHFYLVTPAEKWRITVERHPLVAIDCDHTGHNDSSEWFVLLNTGGRCRMGAAHPLHVTDVGNASGDDSALPWVELPNGLSAQLTRAAWYRLVGSASVAGGRARVISAGDVIDLGPVA